MQGLASRGAGLAPLLLLVACSTRDAVTRASERPDAATPDLPGAAAEPEPGLESEPAPEPAPESEPAPEPGQEPEPKASDDDDSAGSGGRAPMRPRPSGAGGASNPDASGGSAGDGNAAEPEPTSEGVDAGAPPEPDDAPAVEPDPVPTGEPVAVAVGYGMRRVSSRNGLDWESFAELTPEGGDDNDLFRGLTFGGGRFVAVGGSSTSLSLVSSDGQSWEHEDRGQGDWLGGVAFLDGEFVAAGGNGLRVHSEDLGQTWVDAVDYQAIHYRDVAAGAGVVVAVGHTYNEDPDVGIIAVTSDGRRWDEVGRGGDPLSRVACGNGVFVATGGSGRLSRSTDGRSWEDDTVGSGDGSVVFANDAFFVSNSGGVFRSSDGSDFSLVEGASAPVAGYIAGLYLTLDWPARIRASEDLIEWTVVFDPGGSGFTRVVTGYVE